MGFIEVTVGYELRARSDEGFRKLRILNGLGKITAADMVGGARVLEIDQDRAWTAAGRSRERDTPS